MEEKNCLVKLCLNSLWSYAGQWMEKYTRVYKTYRPVVITTNPYAYTYANSSLSSVHVSRSVVSDSLRPHESQHARPPCPTPTPGVHSNSCPSSQWCHPAILSSVVPFFSCPQSLPALGFFPMSQFFTWGGQRIGVSASASVLPTGHVLSDTECGCVHI